ncbi:DUF1684 domain-containing protein [Luteipulveratus mongoliensis]|uniref:Transposase n=1 Tax=Luteipulveratus mongoliensis TaxID=571913 RepID=A0A0K1JGY6_9MICO|nr:DUF1684 domain-containing protein [Luteipulveratus mongoliensis]AKU15982.1 transposase [Luteipulveratus mongoliensis]
MTIDQVTRSEVEWERWHAQREADLATEYGWLSLTGFAWLPGEPGTVDGLPGRWWASAVDAHVEADADAGITVDGKPVDGVIAATVAEAGSLDWVRVGTRRVQLLLRGGRFAVRTRDASAPTRARFDGVPTFEYDPAWVVEGRLTRWAEPRRVEVATARADLRQHVRLIGELELELAGQSHRLAVGESADGALTLIFHDATNGAETALWRTVTTGVPSADGTAEVDFNRTLNLPYAFTEFGTCPAPPSGNRIETRVTAGEKAPA